MTGFFYGEYTMQLQKPLGLQQLEKDVHVQQLIQRIKENTARINAFESKLEEIEIVEEHVEADGKEYVLLSVYGVKGIEGVALDKEDLDSGAITLKQGYETLALNVENQGK